MLFAACEQLEEVPFVKTGQVTNITAYSAVVSGEILDQGEGILMDYGHVLIEESSGIIPNINNYDLISNGGTVEFQDFYTSSFTGLQPGISYVVRAYIIDKNDNVSYGEAVTFNTAVISLEASKYSGIPSGNYIELLYNNFDVNAGVFPVGSETNYDIYYSSGDYIINYYPTGSSFWINSPEIAGFDSSIDFQIETGLAFENVSPTSLSGKGLIWSYNATSGNSYYFNIYANGSYEIGYYDGAYNTIVSNQPASLINGVGFYNLLTVRRYQGNYYFFVNQVLVYTMSFVNFSHNNVGFFVQNDVTVNAAFIAVLEIRSTSLSANASENYMELKAGSLPVEQKAQNP